MRLSLAIVLITLGSIGVALIVAAPHISAWEKQNGYPYGRMCDPNIFNLYTSTCKH